jgi:hypothetical protein
MEKPDLYSQRTSLFVFIFIEVKDKLLKKAEGLIALLFERMPDQAQAIVSGYFESKDIPVRPLSPIQNPASSENTEDEPPKEEEKEGKQEMGKQEDTKEEKKVDE